MWMTRIPRERKYGITRCCCVGTSDLSPVGLLTVFGLSQREDLLVEISADSAREILSRLLCSSFVGHFESMPPRHAHELASEFVSEIASEGVRFYSNGLWTSPGPPSWNPLTDAVYDGGVIAMGPEISACVWIEEDD